MTENASAHPHIAPAEGWWVLYERDGDNLYRVKVALWMTTYVDTADELYPEPIAMVPGDNANLVPASIGGSKPYRLWHDGESYCTCSRYWRDPRTTDDVKWCTSCAGEIAQEG